MKLYHTSHQIIRQPDVNYGRRNADFGGGFYLAESRDFAERWASEQKDEKTYVNIYELDLTGLNVVTLTRDAEWVEYIFKNRNGFADSKADADVIIGPIANDTIYDTYGIIGSGLLKNDTALALLQLGPCYRQIAVKTEKAASQLKWLFADELSHSSIAAFRTTVRNEEREYQELFASTLETLPEFAEIDEMLG